MSVSSAHTIRLGAPEMSVPDIIAIPDPIAILTPTTSVITGRDPGYDTLPSPSPAYVSGVFAVTPRLILPIRSPFVGVDADKLFSPRLGPVSSPESDVGGTTREVRCHTRKLARSWARHWGLLSCRP